MVYTVGEMAKLLDIPASTLRYYDKEGLLPFVERSSGGIQNSTAQHSTAQHSTLTAPFFRLFIFIKGNG